MVTLILFWFLQYRNYFHYLPFTLTSGESDMTNSLTQNVGFQVKYFWWIINLYSYTVSNRLRPYWLWQVNANLGNTKKFSANFTTQFCLCQFQKSCQMLYCTRGALKELLINYIHRVLWLQQSLYDTVCCTLRILYTGWLYSWLKSGIGNFLSDIAKWNIIKQIN